MSSSNLFDFSNWRPNRERNREARYEEDFDGKATTHLRPAQYEEDFDQVYEKPNTQSRPGQHEEDFARGYRTSETHRRPAQYGEDFDQVYDKPNTHRHPARYSPSPPPPTYGYSNYQDPYAQVDSRYRLSSSRLQELCEDMASSTMSPVSSAASSSFQTQATIESWTSSEGYRPARSYTIPQMPETIALDAVMEKDRWNHPEVRDFRDYMELAAGRCETDYPCFYGHMYPVQVVYIDGTGDKEHRKKVAAWNQEHDIKDAFQQLRTNSDIEIAKDVTTIQFKVAGMVMKPDGTVMPDAIAFGQQGNQVPQVALDMVEAHKKFVPILMPEVAEYILKLETPAEKQLALQFVSQEIYRPHKRRLGVIISVIDDFTSNKAETGSGYAIIYDIAHDQIITKWYTSSWNDGPLDRFAGPSIAPTSLQQAVERRYTGPTREVLERCKHGHDRRNGYDLALSGIVMDFFFRHMKNKAISPPYTPQQREDFKSAVGFLKAETKKLPFLNVIKERKRGDHAKYMYRMMALMWKASFEDVTHAAVDAEVKDGGEREARGLVELYEEIRVKLEKAANA